MLEEVDEELLQGEFANKVVIEGRRSVEKRALPGDGVINRES